jgi:hypothetical protein
MPDLSTLFAYAVTFLAGLAVLTVLAFIIVWTVLGIRRELALHRARTTVPPFDPSTRYWRERSALAIPEAEVDEVREGAARILAGQSLRGIVLNRRRRS